MPREIYLRNIEKRITACAPGTAFVASDFFDIASADAAGQSLLRLEAQGLIFRVLRGVYLRDNTPVDPADEASLLMRPIPSPNEVARAIARNYGWSITPAGDTALALLGLRTANADTWLYASDGPYKQYDFTGGHLVFRHTTNKKVSSYSEKTSLVIQGLKSIGKENVTPAVIEQLATALSPAEKETMLREAQHTIAWIYAAMKEISACRQTRIVDDYYSMLAQNFGG